MKPNLLVFLTDDHAQWAMGAYGNRGIRTPALDYLAQTGVLFENAFTPTPVCSPARASFLTGRLPSQHGIHDYIASRDPEINARDWLGDEVTLAQWLQQAGYQTGLAGKWHLGNDDIPQPGFDQWFSLGSGYPVHHFGTRTYSENGVARSLTGYTTQIITDYALRFLHERDTARPFFLLVGYQAPHSPWRGHPERLSSQYRNCSFRDIPEDVTYPFGRQSTESKLVRRDRQQEARAQYYAGITHVDEGVGRLLDELEALGLREDTLIVYTSDHGLNCGHHGIWGKGNATRPLNMLEESIRVPLIFNQPQRLFGGQRRLEFVDHLDVFQTLLDFAGVPATAGDGRLAHMPGQSLVPLLTQKKALPEWRDEQFGEYGNLRMVRTWRYKLVCRYPAGPCELFDLQHDPRETVNRFHEPAYRPVVDDLMARIQRHFTRYEDPVKSGLNVRNLPRHNFTEAWRTE